MAKNIGIMPLNTAGSGFRRPGRPGGAEANSARVTQFFLSLPRARQALRVQAHPHPHEVGHSRAGGHESLAPATGFFSASARTPRNRETFRPLETQNVMVTHTQAAAEHGDLHPEAEGS